MIALSIYALLVFVLVLRALFLVLKRKVIARLVGFSATLIFVQAAFLLSVIFDCGPGSEFWMFLALTYIPIAIVLFVLVACFAFTSAIFAVSWRDKLKLYFVVPVYAALSYFLLYAWAFMFDFPL